MAFLGVSTRGLVLAKAPGKTGVVDCVRLNSEISVRGVASRSVAELTKPT